MSDISFYNFHSYQPL